MEQNILEQILEGSIKPTNLPLETLRKITDGFSTDRIIGEGGFGTVYKGDVRNGNVAVKRIKSGMTINDKLFRREVNNLMEVNHPNVVRFLGLCSNTVETPMKDPESRGYIYAEIRERLLCFEYVSNGSLDTRITDELRGLEWDTRYSIIKGICAGLHYLHMEKHILHMDLKPANILLDNQMVPKITDFGLSRPVENSQTMTTNHFASPGYSAPENLFGGGKMSIQSDMYSLGVIIIELVTGRRGTPDSNNTLRRWRHRWNKSGKEIPLEYHQQVTECIEIGSLCQTENPYSRPFISDIMSKFAEMDLNNHSRNANESTVGQINLLTWEDDMLGVEPLELQFEYNKQEEILSCLVELSNDTDGFILFVIQKMRPLPYSIQQNKGILKPRSKCCVHITMPAAHKAALQYSTSNKRYTKEFVVQSIKVNEGLATKDFNQDMFDKYTEGQHVDEIHLGAVFEEPCSEEIIDLPSKQAKKQHGTSGIGPTLIKPGSVQLVIKSNKKAPLLEYKQKVMLELTGGDYTSDRPGLDLVAVLDVSGSMQDGDKIEHLKTAMRFVIRKLSPVDRLSVVTFSGTARLLCPLRQVTEASQRELQQLIDGLQAGGGTNIESGLKMGIHALAIRKVSDGRVAAMMLMSDGQQTSGSAAQVNIGDVPVYTFGFGGDSDPMLLNLVAANSMGGTFSHVRGKNIWSGGLTMAFSQCLAGLLTVAVQNLEVTVAAVGGESTIVKVTAGSYTQTHDAGSVTIRFGNLYSREVRKVIIDLLLPAVQSEHSTDILNVTYSHGSSSAGLQFVEPPETLTVWRTGVEVSEEEKQLPAELRAEELRLHTVKIIKEVKTMADSNMLLDAQDKLVEARNMLMEEQPMSNPLLATELQELLELFKTKETYDNQGRHYALSSESSHCRQRFSARGDMEKTVRLFATAHMDMYLKQAKEFHGDPTMPLPSVDDDVKEEVGALTINVAAREEEMRRMSSDAED